MSGFPSILYITDLDNTFFRLEQLSKHRFASHVFQTLLQVSAQTVTREVGRIMVMSFWIESSVFLASVEAFILQRQK